MADTMGAHFLDRLEVREAFIAAARSVAGLSWGDLRTRAAYVAALPFDHDTDAHALDMAGGQSSCGTSAMKALARAKVDGTVRGWRGKASVDPLRAAYAGHYDAIAYLAELGRQSGARQLPGLDRPDIRPASVLKIGGGSDGGGADHIIMVTDRRSDGALLTVEGGKLDGKNPKPSPKNCTLIAACVRELVWHDEAWFCRDLGSSGPGRRVRWWLAVEDLPTIDETTEG